MLKKNQDREARKKRDTWVGYYPRKTPTRRELELKAERREKLKKLKDRDF